MALIRHINEKDLVRLIAEDDVKAFEEIFHAYHNQLGVYVKGWTKSVSMAEEIVQDVFVKIWSNRKSLTDIERFDNYLYILARNHTFNVLRQAVKQKLKAERWAKHFENEQALSADDSTDEYLPLIAKAIADLPQQQQKVYILKRQEGLKYEEIADQLNISPETARKHLAAALRNITTHVKSHLPTTIPLLVAYIASN